MKKVEGSFAMVLCALGWSLGGVFLKYVTINSFAIAGFRSLFAFATIAIFSRSLPHFFVRSEQDNSIDKKQTLYLWLSAISYAGTMILYVISNKLTYAANVVFLEYTEPVWVILFSALLIGERNKKIDYVTFAGIVVGMILFFADNLLESRAGTQTSEFADTALLGNILALCSGITFAATTIFQRKQQLLIAQVKQAEGQKQFTAVKKELAISAENQVTTTTDFSAAKQNVSPRPATPATHKKHDTSRDAFMLAQLIVASFGLPFVFLKENGIPDIKSLTFLLLLGVFQMGIPNILYSIGIKKVTALSASLITMIEPLMYAVWVFVFVHELPGWKCLLGGILILALILLRDIEKKKKRG